jgi:hypothetical protein
MLQGWIFMRGHQPITAARHRLDQVAIRAEGLAQGSNMNLQVVFLDHRIGPYATHDLVLRDQRSLCADQQLENIERAAANAQRLAVKLDFPAFEGDEKLPDPDHRTLDSEG